MARITVVFGSFRYIARSQFRFTVPWVVAALSVAVLTGACSDDESDQFCIVAQDENGNSTIQCPDGSAIRIPNDRDTRDLADLGTEDLVETDPAGRDADSFVGDLPHDTASTDSDPVEETDLKAYTFEGSFEIRNELDVQTIRPYVVITGEFDIRAPGLTTVTLENLEVVKGDMLVQGNRELVSLELPRLRHVGGMEINASQSLIRLDLGELETVEGNLSFEGLSQLTALDLPALREVGGTLGFLSNPGVVEIRCNSLETVGEHFGIRGNLALEMVSADSLRHVARYFEIYENPLLPTCWAQLLVVRLLEAPERVEIRDNNDSASCE